MSSEASSTNFEVFGEYVLLKQLAAGGMAEVYLARPTNPNANGRIVVVKRILKQIANDPIFIKMFRSEIRVSLGFNHPHTIQLHDFGEIDYQPYIAMEFIEGKSLKQIMEKFAEKEEIIPVPTALGLLAQAASGLGYAHHFENTATGEIVNAVHRDISPHNLLVSYDGNLKVIDFGIAKAKNEIAEKTRAGQIKGKCAYLSPEQLKEETLDGRSDIFSLGIVAWELLTGHRLFHKQGDTELQIIQRIQNCDQHIVPPSHVNSDVPAEVDEIIMRALAKDRDERYPTAEAFQSAIRKVMRSLYPSYTYGDTALIMRALFESDMMLERMSLRDANDRAQEILSADQNAQTRIVDSKKTGLLSIFSRRKTLLPSEMELRVGGIEAALKQRARSGHYAVAALWVLSIFAIKVDERYSLLDRFFLPAEADVSIVNERVTDEFKAQAKVLRKSHTFAQKAEPAPLSDVAAPTVAASDLAAPTTGAPVVAAPVAAPVAPAIEAPHVKAVPMRTAALIPVAAPVVTSRNPKAKRAPVASNALRAKGHPVSNSHRATTSKSRAALNSKSKVAKRTPASAKSGKSTNTIRR